MINEEEIIYKCVVLAKENHIERFDYRRYDLDFDLPEIADVSRVIHERYPHTIKELYRWVEHVTLRCGLCYGGVVGQWSIPSTKYVMDTIKKIVSRHAS